MVERRCLRPRLEEAFVPFVYLTADASPADRLAGLEAGCDAYLLRPFTPGELNA